MLIAGGRYDSFYANFNAFETSFRLGAVPGALRAFHAHKLDPQIVGTYAS